MQQPRNPFAQHLGSEFVDSLSLEIWILAL